MKSFIRVVLFACSLIATSMSMAEEVTYAIKSKASPEIVTIRARFDEATRTMTTMSGGGEKLLGTTTEKVDGLRIEAVGPTSLAAILTNVPLAKIKPGQSFQGMMVIAQIVGDKVDRESAQKLDVTGFASETKEGTRVEMVGKNDKIIYKTILVFTDNYHLPLWSENIVIRDGKTVAETVSTRVK